MPGLLFRLNRSPPVFTSQSKPGGSIKPNHHPDMSICDCYDLNQNYERLHNRFKWTATTRLQQRSPRNLPPFCEGCIVDSCQAIRYPRDVPAAPPGLNASSREQPTLISDMADPSSFISSQVHIGTAASNSCWTSIPIGTSSARYGPASRYPFDIFH